MALNNQYWTNLFSVRATGGPPEGGLRVKNELMFNWSALKQGASSLLARQKILILARVIAIWNLPISRFVVYFNRAQKSLNCPHEKCINRQIARISIRPNVVKIGMDLRLVPMSKRYAGFFELLNIFCFTGLQNWKMAKNGQKSPFFGKKWSFFSKFPKTPRNVFVGSLVGTAYQILALKFWYFLEEFAFLVNRSWKLPIFFYPIKIHVNLKTLVSLKNHIFG